MTLAPERSDHKALLQQAYLTIERLKLRIDAIERARTEPIAIIGMGCRFPGGASTPEAFWRLLEGGVDAVMEVPRERWDPDAYDNPDPDAPGTMSTRHGAFLTGVDLFDAAFFGISPREAMSMDPQQRILLEVAWEALENAGQAADALVNTPTGVFVGLCNRDYIQVHYQLGDPATDPYSGTGNSFSVAAGRLSFALGLQGPNLAVDTACSSSLVAVHLACQNLRAKKCRLAIAAGVNLILTPDSTLYFSAVRALSRDGRCKTFDAAADGYGRGEGCGVVVLKRLSEALADGDRISAVILGSAINHDGRSSGLTVPNGRAQEAVLREALADARVKPEQVGYIEAHGTGTPLGDPIEILALAALFGAERPEGARLAVGSVKTNIGHLEGAAGVAGLIKVIAALEHEAIPPHLHLRQRSAHIPWGELPIDIPVALTPWPRSDVPRIAGVSAFGFSGANAHVVVGEAPAPPAPLASSARGAAIERTAHILTLSAKTPDALRALAERYERYLRAPPSAALADVAFTANSGRSRFPHRLAITASSSTEAARAIAGFLAGESSADTCIGHVEGTIAPDVAFLFPGQGAHYAGMGRVLFETQPTFRKTVERCDELLRPHLDRPLLSVLYPEPGTESPLDDTVYTQPALFVMEVALAELWRSWGIVPGAVLGHSVGELSAACVAGVLRLEDGLKLVADRARLMQSLPKDGEMAAVFAGEAAVAEHLQAEASRVSIAAVNGPEETVLSGARDAIATVLDRLRAAGVKSRLLKVSHAFHSPLMAPILDEFERRTATVALSPPSTIALISTLTGEQAGAEVTRPSYWRRHLRETVRFSAGMATLSRQGYRTFLEIGPHPTLLAMGQRCLPDDAAAWLPSLRKGHPDWQPMLSSLAALHVRGATIDWKGFDRDYPRQRLALPTYPFQRRRYWVEPTGRREAGPTAAPPSSEWLYAVAWRPAARRELTAPERQAREGAWLIIADEGGVAAALALQLWARGERCVSISPEEADAIDASSTSYRGVIHLATLDGAPSRGASAAELQAAQRLGAHHVLSLFQRLSTSKRAPPPFWIVTRRAQAVEPGQGSFALAHAPLWGLGRVIAIEHPDLLGGLIDVDAAPPNEIASTLLGDILSPDGENQIAYREGRRHVARLTRQSALPSGSFVVRSDGTYLITGGLGGLGLVVARWLAHCGARHLALVGRRAAPASLPEDLLELGQRGVRITYLQADVASDDQVAELLDTISRSMPRLAGVIHAAGILDDGILLLQNQERFDRVFQPKALGAWNLHTRTLDLPLDGFVMFSSAASIFGSPGQASYAAANAFMDLLAHERRAMGLPALSINWGPWAEVGMSAALGERSRAARWIDSIPPARGMELLGRLLAGSPPQIAVLPIDWSKVSSQIPALGVPPLLADLGLHGSGLRTDGSLMAASAPPNDGVLASSARVNLKHRLESAPRAERPAMILAFLVERLARSLRMAPSDLPLDTNLLQLGMDSLMVVEVANQCRQELGLTLYPREVYEHPTLTALSTYLAAEIERARGGGETTSTATLPATRPLISIHKTAQADVPPAHRLPRVVLLLSSPRAGSTLLRVMLAGHPALFCPPELHLLPFDTMAERQSALGSTYLGEGLQRTLMELLGLDAARSREMVDTWTRDHLPIHKVYARLLELAGPRLLVDKSPTYASDPGTLERAEEIFDNPRYLFLVRHPYAVIESFVRKRMDKLLGSGAADAHLLAEEIWLASNQNGLGFLRRLPPDRVHLIRYEDIARDPAPVLQGLCAFLGLPFDPAVLTPYEGKRMTDGVHPESVAIGDPDFLKHHRVEEQLGEIWRSIRLPRLLGEAARRVARELDYELPAEAASAASPPPRSALRESFIEVRGLRLCIPAWGPEDGPLVLCLHGILDHGAAWDEVAQELAARGVHVVCPDLRGHGRSAHVGPGGSYHVLDFVGDVDAIARSHGDRRITLVGHSMGAAIAALFAGIRPERVGALVLIESAPLTERRDSDLAERLSAHLDSLVSPPEHPIFRDVAAAAERLQSAVPALSKEAVLASALRITEPWGDGVRWRWDPLLRTRGGIALQGLQLGSVGSAELLRRLQCPVTLVYGDKSDLRVTTGPALAGAFSTRTTQVVLPGGHNLHLEAAGPLAEVLLAATRSALSNETAGQGDWARRLYSGI